MTRCDDMRNVVNWRGTLYFPALHNERGKSSDSAPSQSTATDIHFSPFM